MIRSALPSFGLRQYRSYLRKGRKMSRRILALACLGAVMGTAVSASMQPLNVKTGMWQMAETVTWTGVPSQMSAAMPSGHTHQYQTCVKSKDLSTNPWAEGSSATCTWTVFELHGYRHGSTGKRMRVGHGFRYDRQRSRQDPCRRSPERHWIF